MASHEAQRSPDERNSLRRPLRCCVAMAEAAARTLAAATQVAAEKRFDLWEPELSATQSRFVLGRRCGQRLVFRCCRCRCAQGQHCCYLRSVAVKLADAALGRRPLAVTALAPLSSWRLRALGAVSRETVPLVLVRPPLPAGGAHVVHARWRCALPLRLELIEQRDLHGAIGMPAAR